MKYACKFVWLILFVASECKTMQQQNSPLEKKPSPSDNQCVCLKPPYSYICMVKSFSQQSCNIEFDEVGPLKAHLRSMHGFPLPLKNIEYYYRKKENKS